METFLLNPNTAAQNPVSQQGVSAIDEGTSGDFSPVIDEAVTNLENKNDQQNSSSGNGAEQTAGNLFTDAADPSESNDANTSILLDDTVFNSAEALFSKQVSLSTETQSNPLQPQALNSSGTGEEKTSALFPQESPSPVNPQGTEKDLTSTSKVESLLLQQIQQILDQGKNNGSITITGSNSSIADDQNTINNLQNLSNPLLVESKNGEMQSRQVGVAISTTDDTSIATQKPGKLEGAHQDITEQYLNAKLGDSKTSTDENLQQNNSKQKGTEQQNKSEMQPTAGQTVGNSVSETKPMESGFSQQLGQSFSTTTQSQSTGIEGKMAPGANLPVPEKEMLNNLIQRFNVNPRLQTSKLTMQLHPAELGALKIDILVKDDSVRANIVAQSQQVRNTLEKHMPRLREVLQAQGFTVDSFEISLEGDGGKQNNFSQEQFNPQQQEFTLKKTSPQNAESFDVLLDSQENSNDTDLDEKGFNVTV